MSKTEDLRHWGETPETTTLPFLTMKEVKLYEVDFDKVNNLNDVINILKGMNIKYYSHEEDISEVLKPYLKESVKE